MRFSIFVNSLTEYCFFWRYIRAIWRPWAVLGDFVGWRRGTKIFDFHCKNVVLAFYWGPGGEGS